MMDFFFGGITAEDFFSIIMIGGLGPVVCYYAFRLGYGFCQSDKAKKLNACTTCPPPDDAIASKQETDSFLFEIAEKRVDEQIYHSLQTEDSTQIVEFFRLCHALGCEVVIRKVSNDDIEETV